MNKSEILYEPLPIGRVGIRRDDEEVIIAKDFSCFANILEEYISLGAIDIVMPASAPEITTFDQMPTLLRRRIRIVDDHEEIEAVQRLLFGLRKEFDIKESDDSEHLICPKGMPVELNRSIHKTHSDIKKLALGFNNNIQIDINPEESIATFRYLRDKSTNSKTRVILAQIEALLQTYMTVDFQAPVPPKGTASQELLTIFDRLINDDGYLEYSDSISRLSSPSTRDQALIELRDLERGIRTSTFVSTGWNYLSKAIKAWSGIPLPDSSSIANIIKGRTLPPLVEMKEARKNAIQMWKNTSLKDSPLRRDGIPVTEEEIIWLPPLDSMEVYSPNNSPFKIGTVKELLKALEKAQEAIESSADDGKA